MPNRRAPERSHPCQAVARRSGRAAVRLGGERNRSFPYSQFWSLTTKTPEKADIRLRGRPPELLPRERDKLAGPLSACHPPHGVV